MRWVIGFPQAAGDQGPGSLLTQQPGPPHQGGEVMQSYSAISAVAIAVRLFVNNCYSTMVRTIAYCQFIFRSRANKQHLVFVLALSGQSWVESLRRSAHAMGSGQRPRLIPR